MPKPFIDARIQHLLDGIGPDAAPADRPEPRKHRNPFDPNDLIDFGDVERAYDKQILQSAQAGYGPIGDEPQ